MTDLLLPTPASINSLECDCKWVRRPMGGSVIRLDIPRDAVSVVCNIKSTRGHTSVNMMPWESKAQYKRWNNEAYKPYNQASHLIDQFHAAERKARSIRQSQRLSLHRVARKNGPHREHPVGHHNPQDEEDALVHCDLQRSGQLEDTPKDDGAELPDRPTGFLRDPPAYEEALRSLGRAPTEADLGPRSLESCSSSLMPYDIEEDRDFDETQEQQEGILEQMEAEEQDTTEAPIKRGMGISAAPEKYQPAPPRYIRAGENSEDEEDGQDEEEDLEAPYLAPKSVLPSGPAQSEESAKIPTAGDQTPAKDLSDSDLSEPMPELIDLREEGEKPSPFPSQKAQHPTILKLPALYSSPPKGRMRNDQGAVTGVCQEKVLEQQIIYIDDDRDPSPLQLLKRQVDSLLMPPPADSAPKARKTYRSLGRGLQLSRMSEDEEQSPGAIKKRTLRERRNTKALKLKIHKVAKMHTGQVDALRAQELTKLASAVVPLQRLKIRDDSRPAENSENESEVDVTPTP